MMAQMGMAPGCPALPGLMMPGLGGGVSRHGKDGSPSRPCEGVVWPGFSLWFTIGKW